MVMENYTQAASQYVQQRAGNQSGVTQFLKLDGAFKQAIAMQQAKDLEEARKNRYTTRNTNEQKGLDRGMQTSEGALDRASNKEIAGIKAGGSAETDAIKLIMTKIAQGGFAALNPGERALYDDYALKTTFEKLGVAFPGTPNRPTSNQGFAGEQDGGGDLTAKATKFLTDNNQEVNQENIQWAISQGHAK